MTGDLGDAISGHYEHQRAAAEKRREATKPDTEPSKRSDFIGLCEGIGQGLEQIQREAEYKRSNRNA